ncbi:MAG: phospholipase [Flavobacteriales bacterium]|nr:phospholipase [Flavobacteriales bacterium]
MKKILPLEHSYAPPTEKYIDGRKNPLLVMAHGYGADQYDLFSLTAELPQEFHVVSFRAPLELPFGGAAWYSLGFDDKKKFTNVPEALFAREKLANSIAEAVKQYDADPSNVWLLGFSQGAILSYGIMSKYPHLVRYFMPLSGYIEPNLIQPIERVEDYKGIKAFATHGTVDPVIPIEWGRGVKDFMRERGVDFQYNEYYMGHGISPDGFSLMKKWVQERLEELKGKEH